MARTPDLVNNVPKRKGLCYDIIDNRLDRENNSTDAVFPDRLPQTRCSMIDQTLLDILACPKCKGDVHYNDSKSSLICDACKLEYPIRDDIPIMLVDEATPLAS